MCMPCDSAISQQVRGLVTRDSVKYPQSGCARTQIKTMVGLFAIAETENNFHVHQSGYNLNHS